MRWHHTTPASMSGLEGGSYLVQISDMTVWGGRQMGQWENTYEAATRQFAPTACVVRADIQKQKHELVSYLRSGVGIGSGGFTRTGTCGKCIAFFALPDERVPHAERCQLWIVAWNIPVVIRSEDTRRVRCASSLCNMSNHPPTHNYTPTNNIKCPRYTCA